MLPLKMAAINSCKIPSFGCSPRSNIKIETPIPSLSCSQFFGNNLARSCGAYKLPRLRASCQRNKTVQCLRAPRVSCVSEGSPEEFGESQKEAAIDLKLPRRSLLVTFTCDACSARSQRLINRLAYERGLVYVQCSGCSRYHKLVDNLGLVAEYKLHDEIDQDASTDHT
ncbi:Zim17-type zinc finger protein [Striga asiatica]|uniref:Zim17-type zinc finger protein n=1 Tax=Striga asiatica TaxID=4170 RepID=A0A5A7R2D1_STRAF|nr:Zim17-type zinc finger protein [Striga asiatica]